MYVSCTISLATARAITAPAILCIFSVIMNESDEKLSAYMIHNQCGFTREDDKVGFRNGERLDNSGRPMATGSFRRIGSVASIRGVTIDQRVYE